MLISNEVDHAERSDEPLDASRISKSIDERIKIIERFTRSQAHDSLRTTDDKFTFSNGNLAEPSISFIDLYIRKDTKKEFLKQMSLEGCTSTYMTLYSQMLVHFGTI